MGSFGLFPYIEATVQPIWDLQGVQRDFLQGKPACGRKGEQSEREWDVNEDRYLTTN